MSTVLALVSLLIAPQHDSIVYIGPKVEEAGFATAFDAAIVSCGLPVDAVSRKLGYVSIEPTNSEQRAELESRVERIAIDSGITGGEKNHPQTYLFIRGMLKGRTVLRYSLKGTDQNKQCLDAWLNKQKFMSIPADQPLPPELSK